MATTISESELMLKCLLNILTKNSYRFAYIQKIMLFHSS